MNKHLLVTQKEKEQIQTTMAFGMLKRYERSMRDALIKLRANVLCREKLVDLNVDRLLKTTMNFGAQFIAVVKGKLGARALKLWHRKCLSLAIYLKFTLQLYFQTIFVCIK